MASSGGYSYEFVSPAPDSLECSICLQVLREPHVTSCCGKQFCYSCIFRIRSNNKPCPLCNEWNFTTFLHKGVAREVNALKVYCPLKSRGCDWQGELGRVEQHLNSRAEYEDSDTDCRFVKVDCYHCGESFERRLIARHEFEECPDRPLEVQMEYFAKEMTAMKEELLALRNEVRALKEDNNSKQAEIDTLKQQVLILETKTEVIPLPPTPPFYFSLTEYKYLRENSLKSTSSPFYSHPGGYKMELYIDPNGYDEGKGTHLSLYIGVLRGEFDEQLQWPFTGRVTVELFNFKRKEWAHEKIVDFNEFPVERARKNFSCSSYGSHMFITNELLREEYLLDSDVVRFKIATVEAL